MVEIWLLLNGCDHAVRVLHLRRQVRRRRPEAAVGVSGILQSELAGSGFRFRRRFLSFDLGFRRFRDRLFRVRLVGVWRQRTISAWYDRLLLLLVMAWTLPLFANLVAKWEMEIKFRMICEDDYRDSQNKVVGDLQN
jgi:hypothetical protein